MYLPTTDQTSVINPTGGTYVGTAGAELEYQIGPGKHHFVVRGFAEPVASPAQTSKH